MFQMVLVIWILYNIKMCQFKALFDVIVVVTISCSFSYLIFVKFCVGKQLV